MSADWFRFSEQRPAPEPDGANNWWASVGGGFHSLLSDQFVKSAACPRMLLTVERHCSFGSRDESPLARKRRAGTHWVHCDGRAESPSLLHKSLYSRLGFSAR
jgi:hypothetical protein